MPRKARCLLSQPTAEYRTGVTDTRAWDGDGRWARNPASETLSHYLTTLVYQSNLPIQGPAVCPSSEKAPFLLMVQQP